MLVQFGSLFWFMSRSKIERIRPEDPKIITFDDYWGQPRLKRLVRQWLGLLSDRQQFVEMGGRYINGLLLYGPPGTGKTMLAKAMAGEAGVAFISIEGSGFRAMFWGVDVMKMIWFIRKARKLAQRYGAAIAYIDEIDAVAQSRGGVMGEGGGMRRFHGRRHRRADAPAVRDGRHRQQDPQGEAEGQAVPDHGQEAARPELARAVHGLHQPARRHRPGPQTARDGSISSSRWTCPTVPAGARSSRATCAP